MLGLLGLVSG